MTATLTDSEAEKLVEAMARSGEQELPSNPMKQLKCYCRRSDDNIDKVFRHLFHELNQKHSQIRVTTVLIMDQLFSRSHRFRQLMAQNLFTFFQLCLQLNCDQKLPKPKSYAKKLKQLSIDLIQKWDKEFGEGYEELRSAVKYLKDNRLVDFADRVVRNHSERRHSDEEQKKRQNVLKLKIEKSVKELNEMQTQVKTLITQMDSCFDLLLPKMTEPVDQTSDGGDDCAQRVRHLNDFSVEIQIKPMVEVVDNNDTNPIINNLNELHFELNKILEFRLKSVIHVMSKGYDLCQSDLKRGIDLKCQIEGIRQKFFDLKIIKSEDFEQMFGQKADNNNNSDDSSDDFEEVPEKEGLELFIPEDRRHEYGLPPLEPKPSTSGVNLNEELATKLNSNSGLQCNAVLPSGKLCPRMDRTKCPFHGLIVPRDSNGLALSEEHRKREEDLKLNSTPEWQNPKLLRELKASIGIDLTVDKRKRKKKYPKLEDIKASENNSRKRLEKLVFKKRVRERVAKDLNEVQAKNQTHFEDQWNYSMQT